MANKSCEAAVTEALKSGGVDRDGYGKWMTLRDIMDASKLGHSAIQRNIARRWDMGQLEARLRGTGASTTQEYRLRPTGKTAPLYPRQEGWNAQALADCLGGFTYYHPADCR